MAHLMVLSLSVATAGRICDDIRCAQFVPVSHLALLGVRGSAHGEFSGNEATCVMRRVTVVPDSPWRSSTVCPMSLDHR